jgi:DUF2075 family protein
MRENARILQPFEAKAFSKGCRAKTPMVKRSRQDFLRNVKNTYRVLLTRGMKGVYVYFMDKDTEEFFRGRIEARISHSD